MGAVSDGVGGCRRSWHDTGVQAVQMASSLLYRISNIPPSFLKHAVRINGSPTLATSSPPGRGRPAVRRRGVTGQQGVLVAREVPAAQTQVLQPRAHRVGGMRVRVQGGLASNGQDRADGNVGLSVINVVGIHQGKPHKTTWAYSLHPSDACLHPRLSHAPLLLLLLLPATSGTSTTRRTTTRTTRRPRWCRATSSTSCTSTSSTKARYVQAL